MQTITWNAPAKINLSLDVTGRRPDGYHTVSMVMQPISLYDRVTVTRTGAGISVTADAADVPNGPGNLAHRAATLFFSQFGLDGGVDIRIEKQIPAAAGLAGGSADAAAVLHALNEMTGFPADLQTLCRIGLRLGADVPFCLYGKPALAEGIGERLSPAAGLPDVAIVLVNPGMPVSTRDVYEAVDSETDPDRPNNEALLHALSRQHLTQAISEMKNVMQPVTTRFCPAIPEMLGILRSLGAMHAMMSGSGPTVFGLFPADSLPPLDLLESRGWSVWTAAPCPESYRLPFRLL